MARHRDTAPRCPHANPRLLGDWLTQTPEHGQRHPVGIAHTDDPRPDRVPPDAALARLQLGQQAEHIEAPLPDLGPEPRVLGIEAHGVVLGPAPDLDHRDKRAVALGDLDPPGERDPLADLQIVDRLRHRLAVRTLDEQRVISCHFHRTAVASGHLEAALVGRVADEPTRLSRRHLAARSEGGDRVSLDGELHGGCRLAIQHRRSGATGRHSGLSILGGPDTAAEARSELGRGAAMQFAPVVEEDLLIGEDRVEDADDRGVDALLAVVGHGHRLGVALGLVVDAARADRVDVAPVVLGLGVDLRVAVDLAGRGEQEAGALELGDAEHVMGAVRADLERVQRQPQVVDRAGRRGEVVDEVDVLGDLDLAGDVDVAELEGRVADVLDVLQRAGLEVVDADHPVPLAEQVLAEVGAEEAGAAGDHAGAHRADAIGRPRPGAGRVDLRNLRARRPIKRPGGGRERERLPFA